jgi:hypothetical protein
MWLGPFADLFPYCQECPLVLHYLSITNVWTPRVIFFHLRRRILLAYVAEAAAAVTACLQSHVPTVPAAPPTCPQQRLLTCASAVAARHGMRWEEEEEDDREAQVKVLRLVLVISDNA